MQTNQTKFHVSRQHFRIYIIVFKRACDGRINAIKSFDHRVLSKVLKGKIKEAWVAVDGKLLEFLLESHELLTMAFFFGLILLSVYFVGKTVKQWDIGSIVMLVLGTVIAVAIALLAPATENGSFFYVFLCGIVAICSMILPGLSGSFILIIMGNYALILGAIGRADFGILLPLLLGCAVGLIAFSHFLSWVFKHFHDQTIALMTGFILGSLAIIWPWKHTLIETLQREGKPPKEVVTGYDWYFPSLLESTTWIALLLIAAGALAIYLMERFAGGERDVAVA